MDIGIVGLPNSGKTTVFNALTGLDVETAAYAGSVDDVNVAIVKVPDPRLDFLFDKYQPKKKVQTELKYTDFALVRNSGGGSGFSDKYVGDLRNCDALLLVLRAFEDESVPPSEGKVDPAGDMETLLLELKMADLKVVENRLARIEESMRRASKVEKAILLKEQPVMEKFRDALESDDVAASVELSESEDKLTRSYGLLTRKPVLMVVNISEEQQGENIARSIMGSVPGDARLMEMAGKVEMEIAQLDKEEQAEFLADAGIEEPAASRVIRRTYELVGLINFYTAGGKKDVTAWPLKRGSSALAAADKIHSDIARGFIRAEVVAFDDFKEHGGVQAVKDAGKFRLEGKEYVVASGDIINFRFNV